MVTRATGASRSRKASSATTAAISAPKPPVRKSSWTIRQRRVRRTLSSTISRSHGMQRAQVDDVGADALRRRLAARDHRAPGDDRDLRRPRGSSSPGRTAAHNRRPATAAAPRLSSSIARCSKNSTGSLPRRLPRSRPTASSALDGTATFQPGLWTNSTSLVIDMPRVAAFEEAAGHAQHHRRGEAVVRCASASSRNR